MTRHRARRDQDTAATEKQALAVQKNLLTLWDVSLDPKNGNDFENLVGAGDSTKGIGIIGRPGGVLETTDGFGGPGVLGAAPLDPHNWILRIHDKDLESNKKLWTIRLTSDHANSSGLFNHRSTMIMNGGPDASLWAYLQDLAWVTYKSAGIGGADVALDASGFPPAITGKDKVARPARGALALNIAKNAGFVYDGAIMGALWHVLVNWSVSTSAAGSSADTCIRGDVNFLVGKNMAHLKWDPEPKKYDAAPFGEPLIGELYLDLPADPTFPARDSAIDGSSNHTPVPRLLQYVARPVVFLRRWCVVQPPEDVYTDPTDGGLGPPTPTVRNTETRTGVGTPGDISSLPPCPTLRAGATGEDVGFEITAPAPEDLRIGDKPVIKLNIVVPQQTEDPFHYTTQSFGGDVDLTVYWHAIEIGETFKPEAPTGSTTTTVNATTHPGSADSATDGTVEIEIPAEDVDSIAGGKLKAIVVRSGSDDQVDDLDIIENGVSVCWGGTA